MNEITIRPLSPEGFAPFGELIEASGEPDRVINQGQCGRWHDIAALDFTDGRAGVSVFRAAPRALPYELTMMERHPAGSQSFLPMTEHPFLITVAPDKNGAPGTPRAYLTSGSQGINFRRGIWHGVLTPLHAPGLFAVVDRIGDGPNLEEHWFETPWQINET